MTETVRPLIGITGRRYRLSLIEGADERYGDRCTDSYMSDFATRVAECGGLPVQLSYDTDVIGISSWLSGVLVTGGQDLHPALWGGATEVVRDIDPRTNPSVHDPERDAYEVALVREAVDRGIPVLGVCRGMQLVNVALGGTLVADLPDGPVAHLSAEPAPTDGNADHLVSFEPGSVAAQVFGDSAITNSWHHQAVDRCAAGVVVSGRTSDGVVEAIEVPGKPILGVQWHPEWMKSDDPVFGWLVAAAADRLARSDR